MPLSKFGVEANSTFLRNFIVGLWFGYYMNGFKESDTIYTYKNTLSVMMFGLLATLYLNVYFSLTSCAVLFYVTLKMEPILENNFWESDDYSDSESSTKFGIFPAVGAEYFITPVFAIFAALGYNPYGGAEFGLRLSVGK